MIIVLLTAIFATAFYSNIQHIEKSNHYIEGMEGRKDDDGHDEGMDHDGEEGMEDDDDDEGMVGSSKVDYEKTLTTS